MIEQAAKMNGVELSAGIFDSSSDGEEKVGCCWIDFSLEFFVLRTRLSSLSMALGTCSVLPRSGSHWSCSFAGRSLHCFVMVTHH